MYCLCMIAGINLPASQSKRVHICLIEHKMAQCDIKKKKRHYKPNHFYEKEIIPTLLLTVVTDLCMML